MSVIHWLPIRGLTWQGRASWPAIVLGVGIVCMGLAERPAALECSEHPSRVTCDELARVGPAGNRHVMLTEFRPAGETFVYFMDDGSGDIFIPVCPPDPAGGQPDFRQLRVVARVQGVGSPAEFWQKIGEPELTGVLYRMAESDRFQEARGLLTKDYPGIEIDKCWELRVGARVPTPLDCDLMIGWGGAMALAGIFFLSRDLIGGRHRRRTPALPPAPLHLRAAAFPEER